MPTNLTVEALKKKEEVEKARTPEEKLTKLREFLSLIPKHKGTEKLIKQVRKQIATLEKELRKKGKTKTGFSYIVEKTGDIQVSLLSTEYNVKAELMKLLTGVKPGYTEITPSGKPYTGIFKYRGVYMQVVNIPVLDKWQDENIIRRGLAQIRNSDIALIVLSDGNIKENIEKIDDLLFTQGNIYLATHLQLEIEKLPPRSGLKLILEPKPEQNIIGDILNSLRNSGIRDLLVNIRGRVPIADIVNLVKYKPMIKPALALLPDAKGLNKYYSRITMVEKPKTIDQIGEAIIKSMGLIRVYTKKIGTKEPSPRPLLLKEGATVIEAARIIHKRFAERFCYARIWSKKIRPSPQRVGPLFTLNDEDIIEIHTK